LAAEPALAPPVVHAHALVSARPRQDIDAAPAVDVALDGTAVRGIAFRLFPFLRAIVRWAFRFAAPNAGFRVPRLILQGSIPGKETRLRKHVPLAHELGGQIDIAHAAACERAPALVLRSRQLARHRLVAR